MTAGSEGRSFAATIRGRVQGVGFRYYSFRRARELGVTGWVRNEKDGAVVVVAEGRRAALDALISLLRIGPEHANVLDVDIEWLCGGHCFVEFEIRS